MTAKNTSLTARVTHLLFSIYFFINNSFLTLPLGIAIYAQRKSSKQNETLRNLDLLLDHKEQLNNSVEVNTLLNKSKQNYCDVNLSHFESCRESIQRADLKISRNEEETSNPQIHIYEKLVERRRLWESATEVTLLFINDKLIFCLDYSKEPIKVIYWMKEAPCLREVWCL